MKILYKSTSLEVILFEGENGYRGLGVVSAGNYSQVYRYIYNPELVRIEGHLRHVLNELAKGLGNSTEEFLVANEIMMKGYFMPGYPGLEIVSNLAKIVAKGVKLTPSLLDLGRRINRILRSERTFTAHNGGVVKSYDNLYSLSAVISVAAAIAQLEDCKAIEVRAGAKRERGPDLVVTSVSGRKKFIEVTARRPSKEGLENLNSPMYMEKFLEEVINIDLERAVNKAKRQRSQIEQADCIVVYAWHTAPALAFSVYKSEIKSVDELKGLCMYSSWIMSGIPQSVLLQITSHLPGKS